MAERKTELIVGVTVALSIFILVLGIIWGKGSKIFSRRVELDVRFENVSGLETGDPVYVRGVKQGEVESISLEKGSAHVRIWIHDSVYLSTDLTVTIEMEEILGGKQVTVNPGVSGHPFDVSQPIRGAVSGDIKDLLNHTNQVLTGADSLLHHVRLFLDQSDVSGVLKRIKSLTVQIEAFLQENRNDLRLTAERMESITKTIEEDSTAVRVGVLVTRMDSTLVLMQDLLIQAQSDEGTLGKLMQDRWLYDHLLKTTADLDSLVQDIKANPKRYIHLKIF